MKRELMTDIMQQMLPYIDNAQLKQLRLIIEQTLFCYEVTDAGGNLEKDDSKILMSFFIAAKLVGCKKTMII